MRYKLALVSFLILLNSCQNESNSEDPLIVSRAYCDCLNEKLANAKDSSVNINECNYVLFTSRFMNIHLSENRDAYGKSTLDSASKFFLQVRDITDTMCYDKINFKKVKKIRQV